VATQSRSARSSFDPKLKTPNPCRRAATISGAAARDFGTTTPQMVDARATASSAMTDAGLPDPKKRTCNDPVYSAALKIVRSLLTFVILVAVVIVAFRLSMPWMARRLMRSDPLQRSDVMVVLGSGRYERTLEAGVLYQQGWAPRIMLIRPPDPFRDKFRQQFGLHVPVFLDIQQDLLHQMHVPQPAILFSPRIPDSTRTEAEVIAASARQNGWHRIIVVTSPYHTARAGSLFEGAMKDSCQVIVHPDRFESPDPDRWWIAFPDRSDVVLEYLKRIYALFW
jgi:uncharacterized SAM-binding protein YcdF (DUF218 family)